MITLLLTLVFFQQPELVIFDTVVVESTEKYVQLAWECPDKSGDLCGTVIQRQEWATGSFRYWPEKVERGQLLKATFFVGQLKSIPDCNTRLREARIKAAQGMEILTPTNSLMPEDCVRQATPFIRDLLERTAPKELKN